MKERHRLAGCTVRIKSGKYKDRLFEIEDWQENVMGRSWMNMNGNACAISYAIRAAEDGLPCDNNVLYGKIGFLGFMIHESEIGEEVLADA